jgi:hypothetical protein
MRPSKNSKSKKIKSVSSKNILPSIQSQGNQTSEKQLIDEAWKNNPDLSELQAERLQEIEDAKSAKILAQDNIKNSEGSLQQESVSAIQQVITALGGGNCLLNAFILAAKDAIAHDELDENKNENDSTKNKKAQARNNWIEFFNSNNILGNSQHAENSCS